MSRSRAMPSSEAVRSERMAPPRLVITADQLGPGAVEVEDLWCHTLDRAQQLREIKGSKPRLRTSIPTATGTVCRASRSPWTKPRAMLSEDCRRSPSHILQRVEHRRLACAGHAVDEEQARQRRWPRRHRSELEPQPVERHSDLDGAEAVMASTGSGECPCRESSVRGHRRATGWISLVNSLPARRGRRLPCPCRRCRRRGFRACP